MAENVDDDEFARIRFERPEKRPGQYTVFVSVLIGGKPELRKLKCDNPLPGLKPRPADRPDPG